MAKKEKPVQEQALLEILKRVLPKAVSDPKLADKIFNAFEEEIKSKARVSAFEKFCSRCQLPDLEPKTIQEVQQQFEDTFGKGKVSVVPHPPKEAVSVEVVLPDGTFEGVIKVNTAAAAEELEPEFKPKLIPFPVCLETDRELVWMLGRQETLSPAEAAVALNKIQEEFWETKAGQKLLRDRVERNFAEFISRVPGKMLTENGLKRHYKEPEPLKPIKASAVLKKK